MAAARPSVEELLDRIGSLVAERQALRARAAPADELEENRCAIAEAQWQLSQAVIERYRPSPRRAA